MNRILKNLAVYSLGIATAIGSYQVYNHIKSRPQRQIATITEYHPPKAPAEIQPISIDGLVKLQPAWNVLEKRREEIKKLYYTDLDGDSRKDVVMFAVRNSQNNENSSQKEYILDIYLSDGKKFNRAYLEQKAIVDFFTLDRVIDLDNNNKLELMVTSAGGNAVIGHTSIIGLKDNEFKKLGEVSISGGSTIADVLDETDNPGQDGRHEILAAIYDKSQSHLSHVEEKTLFKVYTFSNGKVKETGFNALDDFTLVSSSNQNPYDITQPEPSQPQITEGYAPIPQSTGYYPQPGSYQSLDDYIEQEVRVNLIIKDAYQDAKRFEETRDLSYDPIQNARIDFSIDTENGETIFRDIDTSDYHGVASFHTDLFKLPKSLLSQTRVCFDVEKQPYYPMSRLCLPLQMFTSPGGLRSGQTFNGLYVEKGKGEYEGLVHIDSSINDINLSVTMDMPNDIRFKDD